MPKIDPLIHTKLHLPYTRPELVARPRLQEQVSRGLRSPLTLITAPAGFGKTTLVASCIDQCGMPVAWLSLDKDDNQIDRFLNYLVAALQKANPTIGKGAAQLLVSSQPAPAESVLTSLINDLDAMSGEMALVLDDYQFINSQDVHTEIAFLLEHFPKTFHLIIATRSDPPISLARWRARGQILELRAADLCFTELEAAQFLNDIMGLRLDTGSVAALEERTEGWITGLQMAALSLRDREDVKGFIKGFSGTNRYILDYLLEDVLASQPPEIQHFLLFTSILERLTAPLCDVITDIRELGAASSSKSLLAAPNSQSILEYLERANLFLAPLDDERIWYRYHHLFADLLRAQLQRSLGEQDIAQLHIRTAEWHAQNGSTLEAIHHASLAADDERVERFIEQNYMELMSRGEQAGMRFWSGKPNKGRVSRRPWLCIYEALSHSWFGELDEADRLLAEAEKRIQPEVANPDRQSMQGLLAYVKSRVTAMRGDTLRAIELCLMAGQYVPTSNLALQLDTHITLGYEYFLAGDYANARQVLNETIRSGLAAGAVINTVAASCVLARLYAAQGLLRLSYDTYQVAAQSIPESSGQHLGARALVEIGIADLYCEWNDLEAALVHLQQGLVLLPWWDKADDWILAYLTLARIRLAQANKLEASEAVEKALQFIQTRGVFSEARRAVESAQVKLWLEQGDSPAANLWAATLEERLGSNDRFGFENELALVNRARVWITQKKLNQAIGLLLQLEETAGSAGRIGRVIEILLLEVLTLQEMDDFQRASAALTKCLGLAEPEGYVRIFLDEGLSMQMLLAQWLAHASAGPLQEYASLLRAQFDTEAHDFTAAQEKIALAMVPAASSGQALVEPLSPREIEVLRHIALGRTNQEIARQLVVAPGTVKAHTASIYRKLDVANRTEAAARAREIGIIP